VEVNSGTKRDCPEDLVQMLLSGAAIVRFANKFLDRFKADKNFVLFAIYILYITKLAGCVVVGFLQEYRFSVGHLG